MAGEDYLFGLTSDSVIRQWLEKAPLRGRYNPRLFDFSHSMLLVIEVQNAIIDESEASYIPVSKKILPDINNAITCFESLNLPVFFTRHSQSSPSFFFKSFIKEDSHASRLFKGLNIPTKAIIEQKSSFSALDNTCLGQFIKDKGIQTVFICGVTAHLCVESSARSLLDTGILVIVIADAVASWKGSQHKRALYSLSDGIAMTGLWEDIKETLCPSNTLIYR